MQFNQPSEREVNSGNNDTASLTNKLFQKDELLRFIKIKLDNELDKVKISVLTIEEIIKLIEQHLSDKDETNDFKMQFDKVHNNFLNRFKEKHHTLSQDWLMMCAYIRMSKPNTEISFLINIPIEVLENRLVRLKKKLDLGIDDNLFEYILNF